MQGAPKFTTPEDEKSAEGATVEVGGFGLEAVILTIKKTGSDPESLEAVLDPASAVAVASQLCNQSAQVIRHQERLREESRL